MEIKRKGEAEEPNRGCERSGRNKWREPEVKGSLALTERLLNSQRGERRNINFPLQPSSTSVLTSSQQNPRERYARGRYARERTDQPTNPLEQHIVRWRKVSRRQKIIPQRCSLPGLEERGQEFAVTSSIRSRFDSHPPKIHPARPWTYGVGWSSITQLDARKTTPESSDPDDATSLLSTLLRPAPAPPSLALHFSFSRTATTTTSTAMTTLDSHGTSSGRRHRSEQQAPPAPYRPCFVRVPPSFSCQPLVSSMPPSSHSTSRRGTPGSTRSNSFIPPGVLELNIAAPGGCSLPRELRFRAA